MSKFLKILIILKVNYFINYIKLKVRICNNIVNVIKYIKDVILN